MSGARIKLRLFIDQCVPDSVGQAFRDAGHDVTLLRETIAKDSPDPLVCAVAEASRAILVSVDKDMKALAKRRGVGQRRFRSLSLIQLRCRASRSGARVTLAMSLIEDEWRRGQDGKDRRIFIVIGDEFLRTNR